MNHSHAEPNGQAYKEATDKATGHSAQIPVLVPVGQNTLKPVGNSG